MQFEYCRIQFVKGSRGGLYLAYFLGDRPQLEFKVTGFQNHPETEVMPGNLLAQLGEREWELAHKDSHDSFLLKRQRQSDRPIHEPPLEGLIMETIEINSNSD